jgi:hypothetical protein
MGTRIVGVPHWCVAILFAAISVAPSIEWSRHFSRRTLLIATALVAGALAIIAMSSFIEMAFSTA